MIRAVVQRVGDDLCVELPHEIIEQLGPEDGDTLHWSVVDGAVLFSKAEPDPGNALRDLRD